MGAKARGSDALSRMSDDCDGSSTVHQDFGGED